MNRCAWQRSEHLTRPKSSQRNLLKKCRTAMQKKIQLWGHKAPLAWMRRSGRHFYVAMAYRFAETNKNAKIKIRAARFATIARDLANETGKG